MTTIKNTVEASIRCLFLFDYESPAGLFSVITSQGLLILRASARYDNHSSCFALILGLTFFFHFLREVFQLGVSFKSYLRVVRRISIYILQTIEHACPPYSQRYTGLI